MRTKNVRKSSFRAHGRAVFPSRPTAHTYDQPLRWSSEYHDVELGLVYYNYRHYNPAMGRWMGRDSSLKRIKDNLYLICSNHPVGRTDYLGLWYKETDPYIVVKENELTDDDKIKYNIHSKPNELAYSYTVYNAQPCYAYKTGKNSFRLKTNDQHNSYTPLILYRKYSQYATPIFSVLDSRDSHGKTTREHEMGHIRIAITNWNLFVKESSIYNVTYCSKSCANKAAEIVNTLLKLYSNINKKEQFEYDYREYSLDGCDKNDKDKCRDKQNEATSAINALISQLERSTEDFSKYC